ncbi:response regulator [Jannaschia sp. M317]|uniref:response regulator n=1 Tax=Jannaschia sp. M317 TaxID=2867011 RepID=UPI0021A3C59E|nr:response regulator [Jannaschia sp. M317]UWQ17644.1 response regulator [Jannaschia sp. M317]
MLDDLNILIVEDEALVALDLSMMLEDCGAEVSGLCCTVEEAVAALGAKDIDAAILDVDLRGKPVFPVADRLREMNLPFVFHTGRYDTKTLTDRYGDVPVLVKPAGEDSIVSALRAATHR